jgi:hypothetical protein
MFGFGKKKPKAGKAPQGGKRTIRTSTAPGDDIAPRSTAKIMKKRASLRLKQSGYKKPKKK